MKKLLLASAFAVGLVSVGYQAAHAGACGPMDLLNGNLITGNCNVPQRGEPKGAVEAPKPKTLKNVTIGVHIQSGPEYVVLISINGSPTFPCTIDSGANDTVIPVKAINWLVEHKLLSNDDGVGKIHSTMANGADIESYAFNMHELKISDESGDWASVHNAKGLFNIPVPVAKGKGKKQQTEAEDNSYCLLGASFFYNFKSWKLDNEESKLTLEWYE